MIKTMLQIRNALCLRSDTALLKSYKGLLFEFIYRRTYESSSEIILNLIKLYSVFRKH